MRRGGGGQGLGDDWARVRQGGCGYEALRARLQAAQGVSSVGLAAMSSAWAAHGFMLHKRLQAAGVKFLFGTIVKRIAEGSVVVTQNGEEQTLEPVGQVIVAIGVTPRNTLKDLLVKKGIRHFIVGDADAPRRIIEATTEGAKAAWEI